MKDSAWPQLGRMISDAATKNFAFKDDSLEIQDLYRKMMDDQLKGLQTVGEATIEIPIELPGSILTCMVQDISPLGFFILCCVREDLYSPGRISIVATIQA